jgi:hypothetical protein
LGFSFINLGAWGREARHYNVSKVAAIPSAISPPHSSPRGSSEKFEVRVFA